MSAHATQEKEEPSPLNDVLVPKPKPVAASTTPAATGTTPGATAVKPGEKRDTGHAEPWVDKPMTPTEKHFSKPHAALVEGVPTGSVAYADDDGSAVLSTETTVKGPIKYGSDKKKYQKATEATHTLDKTNTTTVTEGDVTKTKSAKTGGKVNLAAKTAGLSRTVSNEHKVGEGPNAMGVTTSKTGGVDVGMTGATGSIGKETMTKGGDSYHGNAKGATAGYKDGHVVANLSSTDKRGHGGVGTETTKNIGLSEGELTGGLSKKREQVVSKEMVDGAEVERKKSTTTSGKLGIGKDSVSGSATRTYTSANGTSNAVTGGAKIDGKGNASVNGGYTRTDKDGNSVSVTAKAGTTVECGEITEDNGRFMVSYKRAKTLGGGASGSHKGVGASASASHESFDVGVRSFKTRGEAEDFKKNAAQRIQKDAPDPRTAAGAMAMEVGESLGHGDSTSGSLGASASFEGASLGVSGNKKSTDQKTVRRISANLFEVTSSHDDSSGKDLNFSGNGIGLNKGNSHRSGKSVTYRFDLATPEGQIEFQNYQLMGIPPTKGGKLVADTDSKGEESHDGVSVFGLLNDVYAKESWEQTTTGENGKQEEYGGKQSHTISTGRIGHWLGDKNITESISLVGLQQDDKTVGYRFEAMYGGESGNTNRKNLANLVGDYDDYKAGNDKSSGEWKMTANASAEAVEKTMSQVGDLKRVKGNDAQMRAMTEHLKEHGAGVAGQIEYLSDTHLAWNLELKGDKNFPGERGRAEHDAKVKAYAELMKLSIKTPDQTVGQLQGEISSLRQRRAAVANMDNYTDLPQKLRMQQLELIDYQIKELSAIRHAGLTEMTKNNNGESAEAIDQRLGDAHAYDGMAPGDRELAKIRDEIASLDAKLGKLENDNMQARSAIAWAVGHYVDEENAANVGRKNQLEAQSQLDLGRIVDDVHRGKSLGEIDELRSEFLLSVREPQKALAYGRSLKDRLTKELSEEQYAAAALGKSASIQGKINSGKALTGKNASYWKNVAKDDSELPVYP